ncbi:class I SAM-dependent methyltransferase [Protofrankia symbiont of Coriaria ruscifolia]|uniref:Methylase involved in ubiquinone/menaquinone biosynthesis n=1 Tax=Candidatus Protofrankia californiensis TaxID=1839754 RepID=A0A1C3P7W0_9ACTN|nr:class I SAM-dependent methyltransferase [Protofrankia symbiont of Coriaria ruscifolia]SBW25882.1 methylase involved in ubiquinone/menaquinone biosynthesis [Candidatus Protofrankia californiensis]
MEQFHFDPQTYLAMVSAEVPAYDQLQNEVAAATAGMRVARMLDLGVGTGETSRRVLAVHPTAAVVALDESPAMLDCAQPHLPRADLLVGRLEDPLPDGPFDLVISALAVHHLDALGKADLFGRIAALLRPGGRFVLADVIVPDDPRDAVTPVHDVHDKPSRLPDQLEWLQQAGFKARTVWRDRDLAVVTADRSHH